LSHISLGNPYPATPANGARTSGVFIATAAIRAAEARIASTVTKHSASEFTLPPHRRSVALYTAANLLFQYRAPLPAPSPASTQHNSAAAEAAAL
jgi:hypothetical protein